MKKMHDEVFFTKLALMKNFDLSFDKFFTITEEERNQFAQLVATHNTSAHVTSLNTGSAGNKSTPPHEDFLKQVGLPESYLIGIKELMENIKN